jgi:hypothetical protein
MDAIVTLGPPANVERCMSDDTAHLPPFILINARSGIRKTTSMYQEWFPRLLHEALVPPSSGNVATMTEDTLPTGSNSFFRQLDHMIATLCNEEFTKLYAFTRDMMQESADEPTSDIVKAYSDLKAAIFTRYRTLSELLGVALLRAAQTLQSNCMLETSGRDVAMFHYVDHFFPEESYNKLALHFRSMIFSKPKRASINAWYVKFKPAFVRCATEMYLPLSTPTQADRMDRKSWRVSKPIRIGCGTTI